MWFKIVCVGITGHRFNINTNLHSEPNSVIQEEAAGKIK